MPLVTKIKNIYSLGVGISTVSEIYCRSWSEGDGACPRGDPPGDHWSVPLNASWHKDQEYLNIWFRGGNLNGLQDIRHFDFFPKQMPMLPNLTLPKIGHYLNKLWWARPRCYIPSFVEIGPAVPEKKIFEGFLLYKGRAAILAKSPGPREQAFVPHPM